MGLASGRGAGVSRFTPGFALGSAAGVFLRSALGAAGSRGVFLCVASGRAAGGSRFAGALPGAFFSGRALGRAAAVSRFAGVLVGPPARLAGFTPASLNSPALGVAPIGGRP